MFGNDILYEDFKGVGSIYDLLNYFNPLSILSGEGPKIDYTKSVEFLNAEFTVPLASGFALTLSVDGTAMVQFQAEGKFELDYLFVNGDMEIDGHIKPR